MSMSVTSINEAATKTVYVALFSLAQRGSISYGCPATGRLLRNA